ncbi:MAG: hypothetical protein JNL97_11035, partial [Verrucomicrobiales bacterium]|nr:hypothetical protein [Verrucomicrobiales bacterium]
MKSLSQPIVEGGLRSPHYFNGRLLSGEDLTLEHEAQSEARRQLGRALGAGVVGGLEVRRAETDATGKPIDSRTQPGVVVEAGQAISRDGRIVVLKERTHLSLLRAVRPTASSAAVDPFRPC